MISGEERANGIRAQIEKLGVAIGVRISVVKS